MTKLLLSDVDGTLIGHQPILKEEDVQAIVRWKKEGNAFGLVTGRDYGFCRRLLHQHKLEADVCVTANGAMTYIGSTCVDHSVIDLNRSIEIYQQLLEYDPDVVIFFTDEEGVQHFPIETMGKDTVEAYMHTHAHLGSYATSDLFAYLRSRSYGCAKITVNTRTDALCEDLFPIFKEMFSDVEVMKTSHDYIEMTKKDIHKGYALHRLKEHVHEPDLYYIGDSMNDIPIFKEIEKSYVMDTASEDVKSHAKYIVSSVCDAIEHIERGLDYVKKAE